MNLSRNFPGKSRLEKGPGWQGDQERVLLYLRMLRVDGIDALEIALDALHRAREPSETREPSSEAAAMRALRAVLEERKMAAFGGSSQENGFGKSCPCPEISERAGAPRDARSMPLLNRGSMKPDRL
jgi:hypothetical protein